ncbi:hypothetical protein K435DRAFT_875437 [Dendrothele bispora CBS 962.96]|uniref:Uncharacterized protein n=1 Tax=Dendrothele bispora (strain CBS 962.96) TaxID=1314807 RepID=A0A4S8KUB0_DENBC|nr:hypothetical protein K435DRAFT_875437 [Dendrothele bispora CBS 962.96]
MSPSLNNDKNEPKGKSTDKPATRNQNSSGAGNAPSQTNVQVPNLGNTSTGEANTTNDNGSVASKKKKKLFSFGLPNRGPNASNVQPLVPEPTTQILTPPPVQPDVPVPPAEPFPPLPSQNPNVNDTTQPITPIPEATPTSPGALAALNPPNWDNVRGDFHLNPLPPAPPGYNPEVDDDGLEYMDDPPTPLTICPVTGMPIEDDVEMGQREPTPTPQASTSSNNSNNSQPNDNRWAKRQRQDSNGTGADTRNTSPNVQEPRLQTLPLPPPNVAPPPATPATVPIPLTPAPPPPAPAPIPPAPAPIPPAPAPIPPAPAPLPTATAVPSATPTTGGGYTPGAVTQPPQGGFRQPQGFHSGNVHQGQEENQVAQWNQQVQNNGGVLVRPWGRPGTEPSVIAAQIAEGIRDILPNHDSPTVAPPQTAGPGNRPIHYLVTNLPMTELQRLNRNEVHSTSHATFITLPYRPSPSTYITTLRDFTLQNTPEHVQILDTTIRETLLGDIRVRQFLYSHRDAVPVNVHANQVPDVVINTLELNAVLMGNRDGYTRTWWNLSIESPTHIPSHYDEWITLIRSIIFPTALYGTGRSAPPFHCNHCQSVDHPSGLCPYPS